MMNKQVITDLRPLLTLVIIGIVIVLVMAITGQGPFMRDHDVTGTLSLNDPSFASLKEGDQCQGSNGYDDIVSGAQVKVTKSDGSTLALSELENGKADKYGDCNFDFKIAKLPKADFYTFTVSHRGGIDYSYSDLQKKNFHIEVTLGQ